MVKEVNLKKMEQLKRLVELSSRYSEDLGVHDQAGGIADAKSILGLLALDYTSPVLLVSEDERLLSKVYNEVSKFVS